MTTLKELIYYCNEPEPVGALMLTGEWGCGKTYLLDNILRDKLADTHIILRVSLFGISSIEAINESVQNAWFNAYLEDKGWDEKSETLSKLKNKLSRFPLPDNFKNLLSFNPATIMSVEKEINGKKVVLIFDDLERSKLDTVDVLGCINDYSENQKFNTIVVANEDKIPNIQKRNKDEDTSREESNNQKQQQIKVTVEGVHQENKEAISYDEIKEKIIERTIRYKPDYTNIISTVIDKQKKLSIDYYDFLKKNEQDILGIFALESREFFEDYEKIFKEYEEPIMRPHNIRSLKCALQDFYRVYTVLVAQEFTDLEKWLYSFIAYMLAYKAGIAKEGYYGTLFTDDEVHRLYPMFSDRAMLKTAKNWILKGEWDEELLQVEIQEIKEREKAISPKDIVRTNRLMDLDEDVLEEGVLDVVEMAYDGNLSLDEYIYFILNSYWARAYQVKLPCNIEWSRVKEGIQHCIDILISENAEDAHMRGYIDEKDRDLFRKEEWEAYEVIRNFWNNNVLMFAKNRKLYLESIKKNPSRAFMECETKRINVFDEEMAEVTANVFFNSANCEKRQFSVFFKHVYENIKYNQDINVEDTIKGMRKLFSLLEDGKKILQEEHKMIAVRHTNEFLGILDALIKENTKAEEGKK